MGTWQATIVAVGSHDLDAASNPGSAELMVKEFVRQLENRGHRIVLVSVGAPPHVWDPQPVDQRQGVFIENSPTENRDGVTFPADGRRF